MGSCFSSSSSTTTNCTAPSLPPTAKVIALDGSLREYTFSATASDALKGPDGLEPCFLCSSDSLHLDARVTAVEPGILLEPDQIYFVLPSAMLGRPLSRECMAELAGKGSSALTFHANLHAGKMRKGEMMRVNPVSEVDHVALSRNACNGGEGGGKIGLPRSKSGARRSGSYRREKMERWRMDRLKTIKEVAE